MNSLNISLMYLTHNSFDHLQKNLNWIEKCPKINEIIIVDDNSTDSTIKFLKKLKIKNVNIKIYQRSLDKNFSKQRAFAVSKCSNDYILWLDPDEVPTSELIGYLNHIDINQYENYSFKRLDNFLGQNLRFGENGHNNFLRLFNKNHGHFEGMVHERWISNSDTEITMFTINHNLGPDLNAFFKKIDFYSTIRAQELLQKKSKVTLFEIIFYPFFKFLYDYFVLFGFLDKTPGIIMAIGMSFHSFLIRAKLWHLYNP